MTDTLTVITALLSAAVATGTIYLFATLGEIVTERAGIMNLGVEGMVMMGAVITAMVMAFTGSIILAVIGGMLAGALLAALHTFMCIKLRASQVVSGLIITILGVGMANFLGRVDLSSALKSMGRAAAVTEGENFILAGNAKAISSTLTNIKLPLLGDIPVIGEILFNQNVLVYIGYILVIALSLFMFKTKPGMRMRAVGENPAAADAVGINVFGIKYAYTMFGGALAGLSGTYLVLARLNTFETDISGGAGWLAVALVIFALWRPSLAIAGSYLFGLTVALKVRMNQLGLMNVPIQFIEMIPYVLTVVILVIISNSIKRTTGGPAALGLPYDREER